MTLSPASERLAAKLTRAYIERHGTREIRAKLTAFVQHIYERLPSGDYGRGDVREVVTLCLKQEEEQGV